MFFFLLLFFLPSAVNRRPTMWLGEPSPLSSVSHHLQCLRHLYVFFLLGQAWHCLSTVFLVFPWFDFPLCFRETPYLGSVLSSFLWHVRTILAFSSEIFVLLSLFVRASLWWLRFLFFEFLRYPILVSTSSSLPQIFFVHLLSWVSIILTRIKPPV